jgi:S1-C subfamily serine protease
MTTFASQICRLLFVLLLSLQVTRGGYDLASLEKVEAQVQAVAAKASPSVVAVTHGARGGLATGSGVIIGRNGLILTAAHVVSDRKFVDVTFSDGKTVRAKVLGANYDRDVALALISEHGDYPFVELGDTKNLTVGDMVVALGHPGGLDLDRPSPVRFGRVFEFNHDRYIRSDCTLVGGDSGGPLFDLSGKVVGVHSSVGTDMTVNNDAPVEVVRTDWQRLMNGERWGNNPLVQASKLTRKELAGLNLERFRQRMIAEGEKNQGRVEANPKTIAQWLTECGMSKARAYAMDTAALMDFTEKALGGIAEVLGEVNPHGDPATAKMIDEELAGLDLKKFQNRILDEALKAGGRLRATPANIAKWFRDCGMSKERLKTATPEQLADLFDKAMGSTQRVSAEERVLAAQDEEELAAVKPGLDKIVPSVVRLMRRNKTIALGTIVRENGFILTKHSEIAKANGALRAKLSDGRTFPAIEVQQFAEHDLALVKIAAGSLPAITMPEIGRTLTPGSFLFTPGQTEEPMLAMGVVSVGNRSLKESGGYLGVGLNETIDAVEVSAVVPNGPAARAGLQRNDQILSLDNLTFRKSIELSKHIRSLKPNSKVQLTYRRGLEEKSVEITLGDRAKFAERTEKAIPETRIGTEVSEQRSGFPLIFQHDQPLNPEECGSVVVDLHGEVVGVNIARVGRVDTYAIPAEVVARLMKNVDFEVLEKKLVPAS